MAPTKIKTGKSKGSTKSSTKRTSKPSSRPASTGSASKTKSQSSVKKAANKPKAKTIAARPRKKKRVYTEKELNIPALNMITPAGVQKPQGKKKGKVFVDDQESMMTILAMVNADKEGQIESKMMKARQMEEIRQARQKEMEARAHEKNAKLEETKQSLRRKKKAGAIDPVEVEAETAQQQPTRSKSKKRVSFG